MRNLKILICIPETPGNLLNQTIAALNLNYGVRNIDIAGVIGKYTLSLEGRELPNIPPDKVRDVAFDYVIVAGATESAARNFLADKLNVRSEQLIFDFEICDGTFDFPRAGQNDGAGGFETLRAVTSCGA